MSQYGSLQNQMYSNMENTPKPEVGMGATVIMYSDREAYTIIEVNKSGKRIKIQRCNAHRIDKNGMSESQTWVTTPNPNGAIEEVSLRKDGKWRISKQDTVVLIGKSIEYYDYSF